MMDNKFIKIPNMKNSRNQKNKRTWLVQTIFSNSEPKSNTSASLHTSNTALTLT